MKRAYLFAAFLVGFLVRVAGAFWHVREGLTFPDEHAYWLLGKTLAFDGQFRAGLDAAPEILRGPGYSSFVALVFRVFGLHLSAVLIAQSLLAALLATLLASETARAIESEDASLPSSAAAMIATVLALSLYAVLYDRLLLSESIATTLLVASMICLRRALAPHQGWACASGICFGLLSLTRPAFMLLPLFVGFFVLLRRRPDRVTRIRAMILLVALQVLVIAPWTLRNYHLAHHLIPVGLGSGTYLDLGTIPMDGDTIEDPARYPEVADVDRLNRDQTIGPEARSTIDRSLGMRGVERIKSNPAGYLRLCLKRAVKYWVASHVAALTPRVFSRTIRIAGSLLSLAFVLAAILSVVRIRRGRECLLLWGAVPLYATLVHTPILSGARYAVPAWPFILCLAATGAVLGFAKLREGYQSRRALRTKRTP